MIPLLLIGSNLIGASAIRTGKLIYLSSVSALYTGFLLSLHFDQSNLVVVFAAAGSMFHAVEYLAVVTHYAHRRNTVGSASLFQRISRYWLLSLVIYILLIGSIGIWMSTPENGELYFWQGLNLWAAFLHYSYDGMIWKLRRVQTSNALVVNPK